MSGSSFVWFQARYSRNFPFRQLFCFGSSVPDHRRDLSSMRQEFLLDCTTPMIRCGWQWYVWSTTNKRCENVWFQASQKPSVQDLETDEWFRNVAKLQFWLVGACWILDPVATLPFLMWHHQLGSRTGRAVTWYVANQMYYIKAPITRNGDWVLERFRHVATHGLIVLLQPGVRSTLALQHCSISPFCDVTPSPWLADQTDADLICLEVLLPTNLVCFVW